MSSKEQFDRSRCFTFFETYYETGQMIEEIKGKDVAYKYYKAIIEYALYEKPIEDKEILLYAGGATTLKVIDSSQERRSRGFGENTERTKAIIELVRDNPGIPQSKIASAVHCSKSTVSTALKNFREGKYKEVFDFNIIIGGTEYKPDGSTITNESESEYENVPESSTDGQYGTGINTNTNYNTNNNINSTERYRYRSASSRDAVTVNRVAGAPDASLNMVANAPGNSADAARLRLPSELMLEYKGIVSDDSMPDIIQKTYAKHIKNHDLSSEEIYDSMVKEFTGGFYRCSEDSVRQACAYVCGIQLEDSDCSASDTDDISTDNSGTDTVDSGLDSPNLADSGLTDPSTDMVSSDITASSDTIVPINQDNTDISGSNPGDAA